MPYGRGIKQVNKKRPNKFMTLQLRAMEKIQTKQIMTGIAHVFCLRRKNCSIDAEQLAAMLAANSHQIFGEEYECMKKAVELLNESKRHFVFLANPESDYWAFLHNMRMMDKFVL